MALPNLVIAGVTKAGTTSLYRYLGQHPDVGTADVKEVDHYAPMVHGAEPPSLDEYAAHFAAVADAPCRLEASPRYFIGGPPLVRRLATDLDRPKVLVAVREPVSRMWSSYAYKRSKGRLPEGMRFAGFVDACLDVAERDLVRDPGYAAFRTAATGRYADHLADWFAVFGDDVRVVFADDLAADPAGTVAAVCCWAGLDPVPVARFDFAVRNATHQPRSRTLRRVAQGVNRRLEVAARGGRVARTLRTTYERLNAGTLAEQPDAAVLARLRAFFAPTLPPLRRMLVDERGYAVPGWLASDDAAGGTASSASGS